MESFRKARGEHNAREELAKKAMSAKALLSMDSRQRDELIKESANDLLRMLRESGAVEYKNTADMYAALRGEDLLVRREDPVKLAGAIADQERVEIDFPEEARYSNAVEWNPQLEVRGLQNAYLEGYGHFNGVVSIVGFKRTGNMDIQSLPDSAQVFAGLDRTHVRSIKGSYGHDDIVFIALRIPSAAVAEKEMTERELDMHDAYVGRKQGGDPKNPTFIHRGFLFPSHIQRQ